MESIAECVDNPAAEAPGFDQIVPTYWPRIFRFVLASVRDREVAQDLTQECFLKAYKGWKQFRGDSSVNTWLIHIAVNVTRDFARRSRFQFWKTASELDSTQVSDRMRDRNLSPEARALIDEQVRSVWTATELLPRKQREVFLLRFVEEMQVPEIARAMRITEGAVKVHLFRAVHAVRERLRRSP